MVITGSAKIFSIYTSQTVFNGQVIVKISTDGKILVIGKLNFAADNISISGRLYADLSKVATGNVTILFLADIPDQVRLLTLYGKLKMGFKNSSGQEVTFDVADLPDAMATATAPTITLGAPSADGGTVQDTVINQAGTKYVDVVFTPPPGASLDLSTILGATGEFTLTGPGVARTVAAPVPVLAITTDTGIDFITIDMLVDSTGAYYMNGTTRVDVLARPEGMSDDDLRLSALRSLGITRFRYAVGTTDLAMGTWTLTFAADAVKNASITTDSGTTPGAGNAPTTLTFTVVGTTAAVVNPTPGASIDINVLNGRGWIDVTFTNPTFFTIDPASITDLAPEFALGGAGLGTVQLDGVFAPALVSSTATTMTYRYWLTGRFAPSGAVAVTFLVGSWSYLLSVTAPLVVTDAPTERGAGSVAVVFPSGGLYGIPAGFTVDPDSVIKRLSGLSFSAGAWTVVIDTTSPITATGAQGEFRIPVLVTGSTDTPQTVTASLTASPLGFVGAVTAGTQAGVVSITPRNYIDVDFTIPTASGVSLDIASILDLAAEFELYGEGLGSVQLDASRAPVQLTAGVPATVLRFRYWLNGQYDAGFAVDLTPIAGTWSYLLATPALSATPTINLAIDAGSVTTTLTVTLPTIPAGYSLDEAAVESAAFLSGLTFTAGSAGWTVVVDTARSISVVGATLEIPVHVFRDAVDAAGSTTVQLNATSLPLLAATTADLPGSTFTAPARTFVDVPLSAPTGLTIDQASIGTDDITLTINGNPVTITGFQILAVVDGVVWVRYTFATAIAAGDTVVVTATGSWTLLTAAGTTYGGSAPGIGTETGVAVGVTFDTAVTPVTARVPSRTQSYLDVTFFPPVNPDPLGSPYGIDFGSVGGDEFTLTGAGTGTGDHDPPGGPPLGEHVAVPPVRHLRGRCCGDHVRPAQRHRHLGPRSPACQHTPRADLPGGRRHRRRRPQHPRQPGHRRRRRVLRSSPWPEPRSAATSSTSSSTSRSASAAPTATPWTTPPSAVERSSSAGPTAR